MERRARMTPGACMSALPTGALKMVDAKLAYDTRAYHLEHVFL